MAVANLADAGKIPGHGRHGAHGCANHRFSNEGGDAARSQLQDLVFQAGGGTLAIGSLIFAILMPAPVMARIDMMHSANEQRLELAAAPAIATGRQGAQSVAVVALPAGDDMVAPGLAGLQEILPGKLDRGFHRFRSAGNEIDAGNAGRRAIHKHFGQTLGRLGCEEAGMGVGDLVELRLDSVKHGPVAMAKARYRRATTGIEIFVAVGIDQPEAVAARDNRQIGLGVTWKNEL